LASTTVVGIVVGSAAAAGCAAVGLGFVLSSGGATAGSAVSAAPMGAAATNPLYTPLTTGATNALF
jgi:hypothetical protein